MTAQPNLTEKIPTWRFNLATMGFALRPFLIHSVFTLVSFFKDVLPGLIVKSIFDNIANAPGVHPLVPPLLGIDSLWWAIGLYVLIGLAQVALGIGYEWYGWTFRSLVAMMLTSNLFASILRRRGDQVLPISSGEAVNRFHSDVGEVADFPLWIPNQVGKWVAAIFAVTIMARINLTITMVIFVPLFSIMFITRLTWNGIQRYNWESARAADIVEGFLGEAFGAVQAIKVADAEADVVAYFITLNEHRRQTQMRLNLVWGLLNSLNQSVVTFGIGVMLLMAGQAIAGGSFTVGDFALFVSYLGFTTQVPSELGTFYGDYKKQEVSIERLLEMIRPEPVVRLLETHPVYDTGPIPEAPFPVKAPADRLETLDVHGLTYRFPLVEKQKFEDGAAESDPRSVEGDAPVRADTGIKNGSLINMSSGCGIADINFHLKRGAFVVVTGQVGSGKSTLVRALLGLLPPQSGEIRWNGQVIYDPAAFFHPPRCAYISQVPRLFSDTLRDNILLGLPEEKVDLPGAIYLSVLEPDIAAMDKGLDTLVGPKGVRLSGGQVQRAAAARMHIRSPELLVFDDLSSALDVETERQLWDRLDERRRALDDGVTCLVVSHRRAVLHKADWILVLKDGKVEAEGKLDELLAKSEEMQRLWQGEVE